MNIAIVVGKQLVNDEPENAALSSSSWFCPLLPWRTPVELGDDCVSSALAVLPRSANGTPEVLVDCFTGKPKGII